MQLCICINYFLKAHNKQLNQYFLNFTIFFTLKKVLKKWFGFRSGWVDSQKTQVGSQVNLFLLRVKKIGFGSGFFGSGQVRKFWPVLPCLLKHQQKAFSCHSLFILVKLLGVLLTTLIKHMVGNPFINVH